MKDTLRLYVFGLVVLAPLAVIIGLGFGSQAVFRATPILVVLVAIAQHGVFYFHNASASIEQNLGYDEGLLDHIRMFGSRSYNSRSLPPSDARRLNVFISHSASDNKMVRRLYDRLLSIGVNPWLAEEDLQPGMDCAREIENAIRASDLVLVCLSHHGIRRTGYLQKELEYALDVANERSERNTFLITVRLDECEIPDPLRGRQWIDVFEDMGDTRLLHSLTIRAQALGLTIDTQM